MPDLSAIADLVVLTVKSALAPVLERLSVAEAHAADGRARLAELAALRDRLVALETKTAAPQLTPADVALIARDLTDAAAADLAAVRERVAVVETRAAVPGPAGAPGERGSDGRDGLGFDDLAVDFDGDRTLTLKFQRGLQVKAFPLVLPFQKHQGFYKTGVTYRPGDVVTWNNSSWVARIETDTKPGEGHNAWQILAKRGSDAAPVVAMEDRR